MKKFKKFYFEDWGFDKDNLEIWMKYSFDEEVFFTEKIKFQSITKYHKGSQSLKEKQVKQDGGGDKANQSMENNISNKAWQIKDDIDDEILDNIIMNIRMASGISYYKVYPTTELIVKKGFFNDEQIAFWKEFYQQGLGEFLYTNQINPSGLFNFKCHHDQTRSQNDEPNCHSALPSRAKRFGERPKGVEESQNKNKVNIENNYIANHISQKPRNLSSKYIVPWGGGKDSIVTAELLKERGIDFDLFTYGKNYPAHIKSAEITGKDRMVVKRFLDKKLFQMNNEGYYNGHVPITGIISFVMLAVCYLYDYDTIVFSNEKSADEANVVWKGLEINHQYSKGSGFANAFRKYVANFVTNEIRYDNIIADYYALEVNKIFSRYSQYFPYFASCNKNFSITKTTDKLWCLNCPKCYTTYTLLRPWINKEQAMQIWGEELFDDISRRDGFVDIMGLGEHKPFECVGTIQETIYAMYLSYSKFKDEGGKMPAILEKFANEVLPGNMEMIEGMNGEFSMIN